MRAGLFVIGQVPAAARSLTAPAPAAGPEDSGPGITAAASGVSLRQTRERALPFAAPDIPHCRGTASCTRVFIEASPILPIHLRFMPLHLHTPLLESLPLGEACGRRVRLKMDALQPSGSFKMRGVGHACEWHARQGARGFISSSGGNAGLAFIHPFDDPLLWTGHASLVDELAQDGWRPDAVVLSVGGGGLLCGVVEGLQRQGWHDVPVIAVETRGADSLSRAWQAGRPVALPAITSIATSLGARQVCEAARLSRQRHPVRPVVVSDAEAVAACLDFALEHRVIVEPACGASLAALSTPAGRAALGDAREVLVVVCGGVGASYAQLQAWQEQFPAGAASVSP